MKKFNFIKSYEAYTGIRFSVALGFGLGWLVIMSLLQLIIMALNVSQLSELKTNTLFLVKRIPLLTGAVGGGLMIFTVANGSKAVMLKKSECYLLTLKNNYRTFKSFYLVQYAMYCIFPVIFLVITYLTGFYMKVLPANPMLFFLGDVESVVLAFALMPLMYEIKRPSLSFIKGFIPAILYIVLNHLMLRVNILILDIILAPAAIVLIGFSNYRWLKIIKAIYKDDFENEVPQGLEA